MTQVPTSESFSIEVERIYNSQSKKITLLEIATDLMKQKGIEPEDGAHLISPALKAKMKVEAQGRNMLKDKATTRRLT